MILKQVFILKDEKVIYKRIYGKAINANSLPGIVTSIITEVKSNLAQKLGTYDYFKNKITYLYNPDKNLFYLFITGLSSRLDLLTPELSRLDNEFLTLFEDFFAGNTNTIVSEALDPIVDSVYRNLKPKISLVGYSGVGKTTITKLIKAEEIPTQHIATINGEISTIKIGKLNFTLWDFAGQHQFSLLWNSFIRGSDAIIIVTDSTIENVDKSRFFLELVRKEAPYAYTAIIGNKQDQAQKMSIDEIQEMVGVKTYSMVAIDSNNRLKMMHIIADLLEMNAKISPLLKPIVDRDQLIDEAESALINGNLKKSANLFLKISDLCIQLGDDSLSKEFFDKSQQISNFFKNHNK